MSRSSAAPSAGLQSRSGRPSAPARSRAGSVGSASVTEKSGVSPSVMASAVPTRPAPRTRTRNGDCTGAGILPSSGVEAGEKGLQALVLRLAADLLRRALGGDDASLHEDDAVRHLRGEGDLVRDDGHGHALV